MTRKDNTVINICNDWSDTHLADIIADALEKECRKLDSAKLEDSFMEILSCWNGEWYVAIVRSSDYTDIFADKNLEKLANFLIEEYIIEEEYHKEAYTMLRKISSKFKSFLHST